MPNRNPYDFRPSPLLIVISGPSGAGKDVAIRHLQEQGYPFYFVVTATSRPKRATEVEGRDYLFVTREEFERMISENELLEYALVYGDYKGVPKIHIRQALQSGLDVVMRVDVQGAATIKRLVPDAIFIFLTADSEEELAVRLRNRCTESPEKIQERIEGARREMEQVDQFDYVVVNHDSQIDGTVRQILAIIQAEKCRVRQRKIAI
jgi:guanylate kinase